MNHEFVEQFSPAQVEEIYHRESGSHSYSLNDGTEIVGLSGNTWERFRVLLDSVPKDTPVVASPELITIAGERWENLMSLRSLVTRRLAEVLETSSKRSGTIFVIGTPLFVDGYRPRNSALLIRDGEVIGVTNKRSGASTEEVKSFDLVAEEAPLLIPGTNTALLICADLATAAVFAYPDDTSFERTLELSNRAHLIGKKVHIIPSLATSLLVISCWGVGGSWVRPGHAGEYYGLQLRNIVWRLMRATNIKEVVLVDRVPRGLTIEQKMVTPEKPYNGMLKNPLA